MKVKLFIMSNKLYKIIKKLFLKVNKLFIIIIKLFIMTYNKGIQQALGLSHHCFISKV